MKNSKITSLFKKNYFTFWQNLSNKKRPKHAIFKDMSSSHCHNYLFVNLSFTHNRYPICHFHIWVQRIVLKRDLDFWGFCLPQYVPSVFPPIPGFIKYMVCQMFPLLFSQFPCFSVFVHSSPTPHFISYFLMKSPTFGLQNGSN